MWEGGRITNQAEYVRITSGIRMGIRRLRSRCSETVFTIRMKEASQTVEIVIDETVAPEIFATVSRSAHCDALDRNLDHFKVTKSRQFE
jgi:hypothetical protein